MAAGWDIATFDGVAFAHAGDTCLVVYASPARVDRTRWLFDRVDEMLVSVDETICGLMLILPSSNPPDAMTRAENDQRLCALRGRLRRLVSVVIGDTLRLNLVRTVMRAMFLMQRQSELLVVTQTLDDGLRQLLRRASARTPAGVKLEANLKQMCRVLGYDPEAL